MLSAEAAREVFSYANLVHAVSGAAGGASAITVFYPLNTVRTHLQVSDEKKFKGVIQGMLDLVQHEGAASLYQGWTAQVVSLAASNFVYFYTYNMLKAVWKAHENSAGRKPVFTTGLGLAMASIAGVVNVLSTTPLWVVGTRLTLQHSHAAKKKKSEAAAKLQEPAASAAAGAAVPRAENGVKVAAGAGKKEGEEEQSAPYTGILNALVRMAREEGVGSLWNGVGPSLVLVSNPTIQFVTYEWVRRIMNRLAKSRGTALSPLEFFLMGAVAKALATVLTYPIQLAQSRLRASRISTEKELRKEQQQHLHHASPPSSSHTYTGTMDCLRKIFVADGFHGLFRGMGAKLWQTVLTAGFQFLCYEQIHAAVTRAMVRNAAEAARIASQKVSQ